MVRRQLELDNAVAAELAGSEDAVLRALEGHLDCDVFLRGNVLTLEGEAEAVDAATAVVRELSELIAQGHEIAAGTIEAVTNALDQHESASAILEDVVWRHRTTKVAPEDRQPEALRRLDPPQHDHVRDRPGRHRQDVPRGGARRGRAQPPRGQPDHPHPSRGRGRRAPRLPARRPDGEGGPVPASAVRRAPRHARARAGHRSISSAA